MKNLFIVFVLALSVIATAHAETSKPTGELKSLRLPSFSIFHWDEIKGTKYDTPLTVAELEKNLADLLQPKRVRSKVLTAEEQKEFEDRTVSFLIPLFFFKARFLFAQNSWSDQDIQVGRRLSHFFAVLTHKPELEIYSNQQGAFCDGLINLRNWYAGLCDHNVTLAQMIFTFEDGPYFGFPLPTARFGELKKLQTQVIPGRREKLAIFTDSKTTEPFFIGVLSGEGKLLWARRLNTHPYSRDDDYLSSHSLTCKKIEDFGYRCHMQLDKGCTIYLDQNLNLRFYFFFW